MSGTFNMNTFFRNCAVCGKEVSIRGSYLYKRVVDGKTAYYCSYTCYKKSKQNGRT